MNNTGNGGFIVGHFFFFHAQRTELSLHMTKTTKANLLLEIFATNQAYVVLLFGRKGKGVVIMMCFETEWFVQKLAKPYQNPDKLVL